MTGVPTEGDVRVAYARYSDGEDREFWDQRFDAFLEETKAEISHFYHSRAAKIFDREIARAEEDCEPNRYINWLTELKRELSTN